MSDIKMTIDASILVPTLEVYRQYFDTKYPCTDGKNDGSDMPMDDQLRFATYEYLLKVYEKAKGVYDHAFDEILKKAAELSQ